MIKRMNLWLKLFLQSFLALVIPVYYHIGVIYRFQFFPHYLIFFVVVLSLSVEDRKLRKSTDAADEYERKILRVAEAACFKGAVILIVVAAVPLLLPGNPEISVPMAGYALSSGIFLMFLLRACIFLWYYKTGLDQSC